MPNIDEQAKQWQQDMAKRVGIAVRDLRQDRGLKAAQLAERTKELGYPIHRVAITKIETNARAGKLDLAEVITLALALGVPPVQLLYPDLPAGPVEVWPEATATSIEALQWFSGEIAAFRIKDDETTRHSTIAYVQGARRYSRLRETLRLARSALLEAQLTPDHSPMTKEQATQAVADAQRELAKLKEDFQAQGRTVHDG
ncbi:helix-turn-helix transcriptional regulator [Nocardia sp. NPDC049707]|uniref:helix-turn-helix transcriptional regulator n=1 Tax=Nocardia sp. NPDC049707 TaxID=3154735 RepID=UPI003439148E